MKKLLVLFAAATLALHADDATPATAAPAAPVDDTTAEHQGYPPARYEELWTKSPFSVETPDEPTTDSAEYSLVGVAQLPDKNGTMVNYASLIEKQNQNHLFVSSDRPLNGLSLNTVTKKADGGTYATLTRDGQILTLKLETPLAGAAMPQPTSNQSFGMPGANLNMQPQMPGGTSAAANRPLIRIRRPIIHVPARGQEGNGAPPGQPAPPPTPAQ